MPLSDEELYSRFQSNVAILSSGMKREAASGDVVGAISLAWGADTSVVEAVLWEHSTVLARYPTRKFFQLGENLIEQVPSDLADAAPSDTASGVVERARSMTELAVSDGAASARTDGSCLTRFSPSWKNFRVGYRANTVLCSHKTASTTLVSAPHASEIAPTTSPDVASRFIPDDRIATFDWKRLYSSSSDTGTRTPIRACDFHGLVGASD